MANNNDSLKFSKKQINELEEVILEIADELGGNEEKQSESKASNLMKPETLKNNPMSDSVPQPFATNQILNSIPQPFANDQMLNMQQPAYRPKRININRRKIKCYTIQNKNYSCDEEMIIRLDSKNIDPKSTIYVIFKDPIYLLKSFESQDEGNIEEVKENLNEYVKYVLNTITKMQKNDASILNLGIGQLIESDSYTISFSFKEKHPEKKVFSLNEFYLEVSKKFPECISEVKEENQSESSANNATLIKPVASVNNPMLGTETKEGAAFENAVIYIDPLINNPSYKNSISVGILQLDSIPADEAAPEKNAYYVVPAPIETTTLSYMKGLLLYISKQIAKFKSFLKSPLRDNTAYYNYIKNGARIFSVEDFLNTKIKKLSPMEFTFRDLYSGKLSDGYINRLDEIIKNFSDEEIRKEEISKVFQISQQLEEKKEKNSKLFQGSEQPLESKLNNAAGDCFDYSKDFTESNYIDGTESLIIDETYEFIGNKALAEKTLLKSVTLPKRAISIGERSFLDCCNLESLINTEYITHIDTEAFFNCEQLASEMNLASIFGIGASAFKNCKKLKTIKLGPDIKSIDDSAFAGCTDIETVIIEGFLSSIGKKVFDGCVNLKEVHSKANYILNWAKEQIEKSNLEVEKIKFILDKQDNS